MVIYVSLNIDTLLEAVGSQYKHNFINIKRLDNFDMQNKTFLSKFTLVSANFVELEFPVVEFCNLFFLNIF
jgi:hypothetical protein